MPIVELPNGQNAEFPDSMSRDEIRSVLQKKFPSTSSGNDPEKSYRQKMSSVMGYNKPSFGQNFTGGMIKGLQSIADVLPDLSKSVPDNFKQSLPYQEGQRPSEKFDPYKFMGTEDKPLNTMEGLAQGLGEFLVPIKGISSGVQKVGNALRPSNLLRGNLSPEELAENIRISQGTETGLGDIIGSPTLKRFQENILTKIPFSGANEAMQRTAGTVVDRGNNILNKLLGESNPELFEENINTALRDVFKEHQTNKINLYDKSDKIANEINLHLPLDNFSNKANDYWKALEDTNILKYEPEMASLMNKLRNYKNPSVKTYSKILNSEGKPFTNIKTPSLKEANLLKGKLNQLKESYSISPNMTDRNAARVFGELSSSLKKDIQSAVNKSGHENLKKSYNKAEKNYSENFSPFLDKEVYKFANGNADADTLLSSFIKTGKSTDRANLINKLMDKLPEKEKNLLGYGYLQRALDQNGVVNPLKLQTLISRNSLGPRQFKALFPDKNVRNALMDYSKLVGKNTKGLKLMQNPDTGQMSMDILPLISRSPTTLGAKLVGAKPITKLLTSEKTRNKLVEKMIKNK